MKIVVLNGSPKGNFSITLQSCLYIQKLFPEHRFQILNVGQQIRKYERDMSEAVTALSGADLIFFSYPVYTFIVPYQLHRFIELIKESGVNLSGKYATQISTSKHFFDVTAHRFIQDNCADMGLKYIKGLSADMEDLTKPEGQKDVENFFKYLLFCMKNKLYEVPSVTSESKTAEYTRKLAFGNTKSGKDTVILTDLSENDTSLRNMIADFQAAYIYPARIVNIREFRFDGGCISCFNCAADGKCIYKDGFDVFLRENIQAADSIIFAFSLKDHSMGSRFKLYDDRQFCNGHRTVTMGMPMGYIINGDIRPEENLRTIIEARCEVGNNFLCGMATDVRGIISLAEKMSYAIRTKYVQPRNFYGVGGMKIFRDLIYLMRGLMKADHKFYKANGIYDFPQKKKGTLISMMLVGTLMNSPKIKAKLGSKINEGMIAPYKKVLDSVESKE